MARREPPLPLLLALAGLVAVLYFWRIATAPIYMVHDEVLFAVQAHALATTWRDVSGRFLPLYLHMGGNYWCSPEHIYASALLFRFAPLSEGVSRVPSVLAGLLAIGLMYLVGRRVFGNGWFGALTAVFTALTPALFQASRFKVESHFPVPFVAAWMVCIAHLDDDARRRRWLVAGSAALGLGLYSYHAAPLMMPVYLALTLAVLAADNERRFAQYVAPLLVFALLALPYAIFLITHPEYSRDEVNAYSVYNASRLNPLQGLLEVVNWSSLTHRLSVYYAYYNPSFLFFSGGPSILETTQKAGMFVLPFAVLLPVGVYAVLKRGTLSLRLWLIGGFFTAPLAAVAVGEPYATTRVRFIIPFAALLAAFGAKELLEARARTTRVVGIALMVAVPACFAVFYADYMGDYQVRSNFWFEQNLRGALETTIEYADQADGAPRIFISKDMNEFVDWYWKFYLRKHDRAALEARTSYFDPSREADLAIPSNALVVARVGTGERVNARNRGRLVELRRVREPAGDVSFVVWADSVVFRK